MLTIPRADTKEFPVSLERSSSGCKEISVSDPDRLKRIHAATVQLDE
jgi:hypothetical protein